nr:hypothetical protein [Streptomyces sp. SID5468]
MLSTLDTHRVWGRCAAAGYLLAACVTLWWPASRARGVASGCAVAGAVVVPLAVLLLTGGRQSEVDVIERSARLLLSTGTPYLPDPRRVGDYTPYLPGMALLGLPRVVLAPLGGVGAVLGDARVWCAAVFLGSLAAARPGWARGRPWVLIASPVVALPLCVSGVDLPLTGLCCLAVSWAARGRPGWAGVALAAASSLKWTAWPAVAVVVAFAGAVLGARAAVRCAVVAGTGAVALVLPCVLVAPGRVVEQVLAFPAGRGAVATPAGSPLPGHLLAALGPAGWYAAVALVVCGAVLVAVSLVVRPPRTAVAAADRLAAGLSVAFLLAPAGRFGYLTLPVVLSVWVRRAGPGRRGTRGVAVAGRTASGLAAEAGDDQLLPHRGGPSGGLLADA